MRADSENYQMLGSYDERTRIDIAETEA